MKIGCCRNVLGLSISEVSTTWDLNELAYFVGMLLYNLRLGPQRSYLLGWFWLGDCHNFEEHILSLFLMTHDWKVLLGWVGPHWFLDLFLDWNTCVRLTFLYHLQTPEYNLDLYPIKIFASKLGTLDATVLLWAWLGYWFIFVCLVRSVRKSVKKDSLWNLVKY